MRIALVSDIHGNLPALQAVMEDIAALAPELVLNLGDIVSGPLWPRETAQLLMAQGWPTIAGNHDRQALQASPGGESDDAFAAAELGPAEHAWLAGLPAELRLLDGTAWCFHGVPGNDLHGLMETLVPGYEPQGAPGIRAATAAEVRARLPAGDPATLLLCGHTHVPRVQMLDGRLLVNPGSVGRPAYSHFGRLPFVVETGSPHARWALLEHGIRGWQVQLRLTTYDWETSARRAQALGQDDWALQLRTGRVS